MSLIRKFGIELGLISSILLGSFNYSLSDQNLTSLKTKMLEMNNQPMEVSDFIREFPEDYPHTKRVDKYFFPNSGRLLIYIPQIHASNQPDLNLIGLEEVRLAQRTEGLEGIIKVNDYQKEIHLLIRQLKDDEVDGKLFFESVDQQLELGESIANQYYILLDLKNKGYIPEVNFSDPNLVFYPGAEDILKIQHGIDIFGAENLYLNQFANFLYNRISSNGSKLLSRISDFFVYSARELVALKRIEESLNRTHENTAILVFGVGHYSTLSRLILNYNKQMIANNSPEKAFSVLTLVPEPRFSKSLFQER